MCAIVKSMGDAGPEHARQGGLTHTHYVSDELNHHGPVRINQLIYNNAPVI